MRPLSDLLKKILQSNCQLVIDSSIPEELSGILISIHEQNFANLCTIGAFDDAGILDNELCEKASIDLELFNENVGKAFTQKFVDMIQSWPLKGDKHELWASACIHTAEFQMFKTSLLVFGYCNEAANTSIKGAGTEVIINFVKCIDRARELLGLFEQLYSIFWLAVHFSEKYDLKYRSQSLSLKAKHQLTVDLANMLRQTEQKPNLNSVLEKLVENYNRNPTKDDNVDVFAELSHWALNSLPNKNKSELKHDLIEPVYSAIKLFS